MSGDDHEELTRLVITRFRHVSASLVLFSEAVADTVGLHFTDTECLNYLLLNGPATAGQLARLTSLTTGAITAMLDRLEKAGYVRREPDQDDRRKVLVVPCRDRITAEIAPCSLPLGAALEDLCSDFSAGELAAILKFLEKANDLADSVMAAMRKDA